MRRALRIGEKVYGRDHPHVATCLNNLAELLGQTNRLNEVEPLRRRAPRTDEKTYGKNHPSVAIRLINLAKLLRETNRMDEAELLIRRALGIDEASYGKDHPSVARDLSNLVLLLQVTNRLSDAEPHMRRMVEILLILSRSTHNEHTELRWAVMNYAELLQAMNLSPLQIREKLRALGPEPPAIYSSKIGINRSKLGEPQGLPPKKPKKPKRPSRSPQSTSD